METAITEKITPDQEAQLARFHQDLLRKCNLSKDEAQLLISNYNLVKPDMEKVYEKHRIADKRFGPALAEFELTAPADYNHDKQIDLHAKKTKGKKDTYYYNDDLTSKNFAKATNKLEAGKKYKVKIFPILSSVSSEDCLNFLKTQRAILVGGQGLTLVHDLDKTQFPVGKWTVSFDEKDALWQDSDGYHRVPNVYRYSDGDWGFDLGPFEGDWRGGHCLLCFCDPSAQAL